MLRLCTFAQARHSADMGQSRQCAARSCPPGRGREELTRGVAPEAGLCQRTPRTRKCARLPRALRGSRGKRTHGVASPTGGNDRRRSVTLDTLAPLGEISGVQFISLQKGPPAADAARPLQGMELHDFTEDLHDFADTAALIDGLDLVISVDTAVAHLAGALGKPVWVLNRFSTDFRWPRDRTTVLGIRRCVSFVNPLPGTGRA